MAAELEKEVLKGGGFLLTETLPAQVISPEDFSDEQNMTGQTTSEFVDREIVPRPEDIETKDYELQRALITQAAVLGLIIASVPTEYGGLEFDHVSYMLIAAHL